MMVKEGRQAIICVSPPNRPWPQPLGPSKKRRRRPQPCYRESRGVTKEMKEGELEFSFCDTHRSKTPFL